MILHYRRNLIRLINTFSIDKIVALFCVVQRAAPALLVFSMIILF